MANQCITVHHRTTRYPFFHSGALFLCTFFAYFTLTFFSFMLHIFSCCFMLHQLHVALFCVALILCVTLFVLNFFILHSFQVALFLCCILFMLCLSSCCFMLHFFRFALFFILHYFQVSLFLCCTFFVLHFSVLDFFSFCTIFEQHFFSCCTHFVLHFFHVALFSCLTFFRVIVFSCCSFCALFSCCMISAVLILCCTFFMLHFFHAELFSCCTFFVLYRCSLFSLHLLGIQASNFIKKRLHQRRFPVKFVKFLRISVLKNICERQLLKIFPKLCQCQSLTIQVYYRE